MQLNVNAIRFRFLLVGFLIMFFVIGAGRAGYSFLVSWIRPTPSTYSYKSYDSATRTTAYHFPVQRHDK